MAEAELKRSDVNKTIRDVATMLRTRTAYWYRNNTKILYNLLIYEESVNSALKR